MEKCECFNRLIDWFITIQNKYLHIFVNLYNKNFYPSIKGKVLIEVLKFAETYIADEDKRIIKHSKKSLFFNN